MNLLNRITAAHVVTVIVAGALLYVLLVCFFRPEVTG